MRVLREVEGQHKRLGSGVLDFNTAAVQRGPGRIRCRFAIRPNPITKGAGFASKKTIGSVGKGDHGDIFRFSSMM